MKKILLIIAIVFCVSCSSDEQQETNDPLKYRKELAELNIEFEKEEFLNHVIKNDILVVELFLKAGMNPNAEISINNGVYVKNPLGISINNNYADMARLLLQYGADPLRKINERTPVLLYIAVMTIRKDIVKYMLSSINSEQKKAITFKLKKTAFEAAEYIGQHIRGVNERNGSKSEYLQMIKVIESELGISLVEDIKNHMLAQEKIANALREKQRKVEQIRRQKLLKNQAEIERKRKEELEAKAAQEKIIQEQMAEAAKGLVINDDGTITDTKRNLMWMRCSLSQKWDGNTCAQLDKEKQFTWNPSRGKEISKYLSAFEFAGHNDWRIPTSEELYGLVFSSSGERYPMKEKRKGKMIGGGCKNNEIRCKRPAILERYFPNTPRKKFVAIGSIKPKKYGYIHFSNGNVSSIDIVGYGTEIRLVRSTK